MMERLVCVAIGYLFGLFQTAYIYGKLHGIDIRNYGSGNAGTTNTLRVLGTKAGLIVLAGDILKCILAIAAVRLLFAGGVHEDMYYLLAMYAALGAILGHDYPFYLGFKGGKGVLVAAGAILAIQPVLLPFLALIFLACLLPTGMVSLGSVTMAALYPVLTILYGVFRGYSAADLTVCTIGSVIMGAMVIYMHRSNIQRIREGKEYRFGRHGKK